MAWPLLSRTCEFTLVCDNHTHWATARHVRGTKSSLTSGFTHIEQAPPKPSYSPTRQLGNPRHYVVGRTTHHIVVFMLFSRHVAGMKRDAVSCSVASSVGPVIPIWRFVCCDAESSLSLKLLSHLDASMVDILLGRAVHPPL
eukprot:scaffold8103_cov403-Prasinococcus_capsulatus_cf.AAC.2